MSYEGYTQCWCTCGNYWTEDAYEDASPCKKCGKEAAFRNAVDDTNCEAAGFIQPVLKKEAKCEHCGSITSRVYEMPKDTNEPC